MSHALRVCSLLGVSFAAALLVGCTSDPYPLPDAPPNSSQTNPAPIGERIHGNLLYLTARPGDRIELVRAEAIGSLDVAPVDLFVSRVIKEDDGDWLWGDLDHIEPLPGAVFVGTEPLEGSSFSQVSTVLIVGATTPLRAGRVEVTDIRLTYRINDGPERVGLGIDTVWAVCAADPAPTDCADAPF